MTRGLVAFPRHLVRIAREEWPAVPGCDDHKLPLELWQSRDWLVQVYQERGGLRVSVRRISGLDGITWDELQGVKAGIGRGDRWAVELYPPDDRVVNVANMRHLWLLDGPPPMGWGRS